jgi:hypothetical protein
MQPSTKETVKFPFDKGDLGDFSWVEFRGANLRPGFNPGPHRFAVPQKNNWPGGGGTRPVGERRKWYMNFD